MSAEKPPIRVAILAFEAATAATIYGMHDLFCSAGRDWGLITDGVPGASRFASQVVAMQAGPMQVCNGVRLTPDAALGEVETPDVICVPELYVAPDAPLGEAYAEVVAWLRACHDAGAVIATACSGTLLLAETGLLCGQPATSHWAYCEALARRYPDIDVQAQRALVVAGPGQRLLMAGGGTSWLDMALFVIARFCGIDVAMQVARMNLIDWHVIGQQPFASLTCARQGDDARIAAAQAWIAEHYASASPVAAMARVSGLPERSFARRFKAATGLSPIGYVHALRLEEAKQQLEATTQAVEAIAAECGYEDAGYFSRLFRARVGLSPAQYRRQFGSLRRALAPSALAG